MKVPRITLGVYIRARETEKKYEGSMVIGRIDYPNKRFIVRLKHIDERTNEYVDHLIGPVWIQFDDYDPLPNQENFALAVSQWDYDYRMAEGAKYEEGKEWEKALARMFRELPQNEQVNYRKIAEIVVISATMGKEG